MYFNIIATMVEKLIGSATIYELTVKSYFFMSSQLCNISLELADFVSIKGHGFQIFYCDLL